MEKLNDKKHTPLQRRIIRRKFSGVVVGDKMNKTRVVAVEMVKISPKYHKRYRIKRKFKVHDEKNLFKEGDKALFVECRPISREKKWRMVYGK